MPKDPVLNQTIATVLRQLEDDAEIVVCIASPHRVVARLSDAVLEVVPNTSLTFVELQGLRNLIFQAISNSNFFDWEMPTLTGFTAEEFRAIAEKLPQG